MILLVRYWREIGVGILAVALLALLAWNARVSAERDAMRVERDALSEQLATISRDTAAKEIASVERVRDAEQTAANKKERSDAIQAAPAGATGPASRALGCLRWSRAHPNAVSPAACR